MKDIERNVKKYGKLGFLRTRKKLRIAKLKNKLKEIWEELTLSDLYEMYEIVEDESLRKKIEQAILEMATGDDDLLNIIKNEADSLKTNAWEKLRFRIQNGCIKKVYVREILSDIFEHVPGLRKEVWKLLKTLEPTDKELRSIQDFDFMYSMPSLVNEIEKLLRKKHKNKKSDTTHIVRQIQKIIEEINKSKKGQE